MAWDWTQGSQAIGEHSTHLANGRIKQLQTPVVLWHRAGNKAWIIFLTRKVKKLTERDFRSMIQYITKRED